MTDEIKIKKKRLRHKRGTTEVIGSLKRNSSKLSLDRKSVLELPSIISIGEERYKFKNLQDPIGRAEKEMLVRKH